MEELINYINSLTTPYIEVFIDGAVVRERQPVGNNNVGDIVKEVQFNNPGKSVKVKATNSDNGTNHVQARNFELIPRLISPDQTTPKTKTADAQPLKTNFMAGLGGLEGPALGILGDQIKLLNFENIVPGLQATNAQLQAKIAAMEIEKAQLLADKNTLQLTLDTYEKNKELDLKIAKLETSKPSMMGLGDPNDPSVFRENVKTIGEVFNQIRGNGSGMGGNGADPFAAMSPKQKEFMSACVEICKANQEGDLEKFIVITNYLKDTGTLDETFNAAVANFQQARNGGSSPGTIVIP